MRTNGTDRPPALRTSPGKSIVFVAGDLKNGGILGAAEGVKEAGRRGRLEGPR